jgi:hypothetical protein
VTRGEGREHVGHQNGAKGNLMTVPLMLCVRGDVNLICNIVTRPMATVSEHNTAREMSTLGLAEGDDGAEQTHRQRRRRES